MTKEDGVTLTQARVVAAVAKDRKPLIECLEGKIREAGAPFDAIRDGMGAPLAMVATLVVELGANELAQPINGGKVAKSWQGGRWHKDADTIYRFMEITSERIGTLLAHAFDIRNISRLEEGIAAS